MTSQQISGSAIGMLITLVIICIIAAAIFLTDFQEYYRDRKILKKSKQQLSDDRIFQAVEEARRDFS